MSRVDDLIEELCPLGVVFKDLGDVGTIFGGLTGKSKADFTGGNARFVSYTNVFNNVATNVTADDFVRIGPNEQQHSLRRGDILFTGSSETPHEVAMSSVVTEKPAEPLYLNSFSIGYRLNDSSLLEPEFAKHLFRSTAMRTQFVRTANGVTRFNVSKARLAEVKAPFPPTEVQQEIARVLDLFVELESELKAELEARRQQHAFYWSALLTPNESWRPTTVGEVAEVFDGPHATPNKTDVGPWYLSISSLKNGRVDLTESAHLGEDEFPTWTRRVAPRVGDTLFSYETRVGQAAYWDKDEPAALGRRMGLLRPRDGVVDPQFLTRLYLGPQFQKLIEAKTVRGSTVDRIPIANMAEWEIAIPAPAEQERIVDLLNRFDELENDRVTGLPAELNARRKQYEYYRDRLLTFKEIEA